MTPAPRSFARTPRHAGLARFVECLFYAEGQSAHRLERILPSGNAQLLVNLANDSLRTVEGGPVHRCGGVAVSGPYTESFVIESAMMKRVAGVAFRPGGAAPFFRVPVGELRGAHVDCDDLWGGFARDVRERLAERAYRGGGADVLDELESTLVERASSFRVDPMIRHATRALEAGGTVAALRAQLGLSPARFIKRFQKHVGLTPKRFARVRRFRRLLTAVVSGTETPWARLASAHGYADQAHMIREFRALSSVTPAVYQARVSGETGHLIIA